MEGAGVRLKRVFGQREVKFVDPFLLLDDFHSDNPNDYIAGFPWHPHRGIETVTYMLEGSVEHEDSIGNQGIINSGDVQWMTAGRGIVHQEMPKQNKGTLWGFQLWVNLPASQKMMKPRYQEILSETIPEVTLEGGAKVKIISGNVSGVTGPVKDIVAEPQYLDVEVPPNSNFSLSTVFDHTVFCYIIKGKGMFGESQDQLITTDKLVLFDKGDEIKVNAKDEAVRFLLISGKPINEPIAWYGPIVMNTQEELQLAFSEYRNGTFLK